MFCDCYGCDCCNDFEPGPPRDLEANPFSPWELLIQDIYAPVIAEQLRPIPTFDQPKTKTVTFERKDTL